MRHERIATTQVRIAVARFESMSILAKIDITPAKKLIKK